jgi:hypothetical protein
MSVGHGWLAFLLAVFIVRFGGILQRCATVFCACAVVTIFRETFSSQHFSVDHRVLSHSLFSSGPHGEPTKRLIPICHRQSHDGLLYPMPEQVEAVDDGQRIVHGRSLCGK